MDSQERVFDELGLRPLAGLYAIMRFDMAINCEDELSTLETSSMGNGYAPSRTLKPMLFQSNEVVSQL